MFSGDVSYFYQLSKIEKKSSTTSQKAFFKLPKANLITSNWLSACFSVVPDCSFGDMVAKPVQLFMFCAIYGPSSLVLLVCYGYIYFVARGHARAIRSEQQQSVHRQQPYNGAVGPPRYGLALAITTGLFVGLWMPFQVGFLPSKSGILA